MTDITGALIAIEYTLAFLVAFGALLIMWGFIPLALAPRSTPGVRSLARAVLLICGGIVLLSIWWLVSADEPARIAISAVLLGGIYHMLRVLHLTIPEEDRAHYSFLTAAFHPRRWREALARTFDALLTRMGRD